VAADAEAGPLRAGHHHRGVPAVPQPVASLDCLVTREERLFGDTDRVDVRRDDGRRDRDAALPGALEQAQQDVAGTGTASLVDQAVESLEPLVRLTRIDVRHREEQWVDEWGSLVASKHKKPRLSSEPRRIAGRPPIVARLRRRPFAHSLPAAR